MSMILLQPANKITHCNVEIKRRTIGAGSTGRWRGTTLPLPLTVRISRAVSQSEERPWSRDKRRALYTVGGRQDDVLQVWHIDRTTGRLNRLQSWHQHSGRSVAVTAERDTFLAVSDTFDGVLRFTADPVDGRLHAPTLAAEVPKPLSIATLSDPI